MNDLKVLVVDDESRMRKLVRDFLVKDGYSVVEAADGEEAVDVFMSDKDISLIILDVMMPKLDGYGVADTEYSSGGIALSNWNIRSNQSRFL